MCVFISYVGEHGKTVLAFGGLLVTSAIKTLPPPGTPFKWYEFFYDWSHQFFNLPNNRLLAGAVPTPPLANPQPSPTGNTEIVK